MGGCATRDLIKHDMDKFSNNINDQYFFKKLDLSYLIELDDIKSQIHAGEILEKIINHRKYLKNYFSSFEKKLASKKDFKADNRGSKSQRHKSSRAMHRRPKVIR